MICELDEKFYIDLTRILLRKRLVLAYSLITEVMHYQILFYRIEIELLVFKLCPVSVR